MAIARSKVLTAVTMKTALMMEAAGSYKMLVTSDRLPRVIFQKTS